MGLDDEKVDAAASVGISIITIPHPAKAFRSSSRHNHNGHHADVLSTIEDASSTRSLSPATTLSPDGKTDLNPFSPFYNHSPTRHSLEAQRSESRQRDALAGPGGVGLVIPGAGIRTGGLGVGAGSPITPTTTTGDDTDLEAGSTPPTSACSLDKSPTRARAADDNFHCTVWPSRRAMQLKKKAMRREKARHVLGGAWMASLSKSARMWVKVALAAVLVGAAVGIAIGISKAVGGGVWKSNQATNAPLASG